MSVSCSSNLSNCFFIFMLSWLFFGAHLFGSFSSLSICSKSYFSSANVSSSV